MILPRTIAFLVGALAAPALAHADDHAYRAEVGIADAVGGAMFAGGAAAESTPLAVAGLIAMTVAGPADHAIHANYGRAGISLAAHLVIPPLVGIGLLAGGPAHSWSGAFDAGLAGFLIAHLAVSALDVGLAYRDKADPKAARTIAFAVAF